MKLSSAGESAGTSVPCTFMRQGVAADVARGRWHADAGGARQFGHIGHSGNGDSMLAYHLMDFSRYFFDQSDIRR